MNTVRIALACGLLLLVACRPPETGATSGVSVPPETPGAQIEADLAAIEEFNRLYVTALNTSDMELLSSLTTEDHIMMAPNAPAFIGKKANDDLNGPVLAKYDNVEIWTPLETEVGGDWAWQRGAYDITMTPKDGSDGKLRSVGKYLHIYRRQADGSWRMIRDMYSSDYPAGVTPPPREAGP